MFREDITFKIIRNKSSYDFKLFPEQEDDYINNTKHNCEDSFVLYKDKEEIFRCDTVQTYVNFPNAHKGDTIAPGKIQLMLFLAPGVSFADSKTPGRIKIHGFINGKTLDGNVIGEDAMIYDSVTKKKRGRVLLHTTYFPPKDKETKAYSEACCIFGKVENKPQFYMDAFNAALLENKLKQFDIISGELKEV